MIGEWNIVVTDRPVPGAYSPRGAAKTLWHSRDFEVMISGPAETGKTRACCEKVYALACKYPNSQHVILRKTYNDLVGTVVRTWEQVIAPYRGDGIATVFGGRMPKWYDFPNGARVWLAGLDNPGKALSAERDTIYVNQAEQLAASDWEILSTRATGRGGVMRDKPGGDPWTQIIGDCNPDHPGHWILKRPSLRRLESRHEDNPVLFDAITDARGRVRYVMTKQGAKTLGILNNLTGARRERLRFGRWVQSEGVVYEEFDAARNLIDFKQLPPGWRSWRKIRAFDWGYTNPFVCQWWAIDPDGRMYLYREVYYTHRIVSHHAIGAPDPDNPTKIVSPGIVRLSHGERYEANVADHDAEDRATLAQCGIPTRPAYKDRERGIKLVKARLLPAGDGKPRLYVVRGCTAEIDPWLVEHKKPLKTEEEFNVYAFPQKSPGSKGEPRNPKESPVDKDDHGMDAMRYAVAYEDVQRHGGVKVEDKVERFEPDQQLGLSDGNGQSYNPGGVEVF